MIKIWLDDQIDDDIETRRAPKGYIGAHSVNEAKKLILQARENNEEVFLDLDNDLGDYAKDGGDGNRLVLWLHENEYFYDYVCHSMNVKEKEWMNKYKEKYWPK